MSPAWVREIEERLPELPDQMRARFVQQYALSEYDAGVLTADRDLALFYEAVAAEVDPKQSANWISGDLRALLNETGTDISDSKVTSGRMIELIELVAGLRKARPNQETFEVLDRDVFACGGPIDRFTPPERGE